jgi:single-strand DNA-binding protein
MTHVTLMGNVVDDVVLRHTNGGVVANFRMAAADRYPDKRTGQWTERTVFLRVSAWRELGENVAASLTKGQPVIVVGKLRQREYDTKDGEHKSVVEVDASKIGHDLSRGVGTFVRNRRGPQTSDFAAPYAGDMEVVELRGDSAGLIGSAAASAAVDPDGWAVPGLAPVTSLADSRTEPAA